MQIFTPLRNIQAPERAPFMVVNNDNGSKTVMRSTRKTAKPSCITAPVVCICVCVCVCVHRVLLCLWMCCVVLAPVQATQNLTPVRTRHTVDSNTRIDCLLRFSRVSISSDPFLHIHIYIPSPTHILLSSPAVCPPPPPLFSRPLPVRKRMHGCHIITCVMRVMYMFDMPYLNV